MVTGNDGKAFLMNDRMSRVIEYQKLESEAQGYWPLKLGSSILKVTELLVELERS